MNEDECSENFHMAKVFLDSLLWFGARTVPIISEVLTTRISYLCSDLWCAVYTGKVKYVELFMTAVLDSKLVSLDKLELLSGKESIIPIMRDSSVLANSFECAKLYAKGILGSSLPIRIIVYLLSLEHETFGTFFFLALIHWNSEFIEGFIREVSVSKKLQEHDKIDIFLLCHREFGLRSVMLSLMKKDVRCVRCFLENVLSSRLSSGEKKRY